MLYEVITLPSLAVCAQCHATAPDAAIPEVWERLSGPDARPWRAVTRLAEHVMFSHRRHVTLGGLACASCHAGIGQGTTPPSRNNFV